MDAKNVCIMAICIATWIIMIADIIMVTIVSYKINKATKKIIEAHKILLELNKTSNEKINLEKETRE